MTIKSLLSAIKTSKQSKEQAQQQRDNERAEAGRSAVEATIAQLCPGTWEHLKDSVTGACVVRRRRFSIQRESFGVLGEFLEREVPSRDTEDEGIVALILENEWLLYLSKSTRLFFVREYTIDPSSDPPEFSAQYMPIEAKGQNTVKQEMNVVALGKLLATAVADREARRAARLASEGVNPRLPRPGESENEAKLRILTLRDPVVRSAYMACNGCWTYDVLIALALDLSDDYYNY